MCFIEKNNKLESVLTFLHLFDLFAANLSGSWAIYFWLESGDPVYSWEQTGISQDALAPCMWYCSFDWRLISDFRRQRAAEFHYDSERTLCFYLFQFTWAADCIGH